MITQPARVSQVAREFYLLETLPKSACPRCAEGKGCGGGILAQAFANKTYQLKVGRNQLSKTEYKTHELVTLGIDSRGLLWASLALYLFPLLSMMIGSYLLGSQANFHDGYTVMGAIVGLIIGSFFASTFSRRLIQSGLTQPVIVENESVNCWYPAE